MNNIFGTIKIGTPYFICIVNCRVMIMIITSLVEGSKTVFPKNSDPGAKKHYTHPVNIYSSNNFDLE